MNLRIIWLLRLIGVGGYFSKFFFEINSKKFSQKQKLQIFFFHCSIFIKVVEIIRIVNLRLSQGAIFAPYTLK